MEIKKLTSLIIEPTNTCNLRCTFCYVTEGMNRPDGFMDFKLFKKIIDESPGLEHLCMHNWGEPLLHKDIFQMVNYAGRSGVKHIVMNTNGTLLTDEVIDRLVNSALTVVRFSVDGSPETYQRIRGVSLEKIEKLILRLKKRKETIRPALSLGVVFTVEEDTQSDADSYMAYWKNIVDHVRLQPKLVRSPRREVCPEPFGKDYGKLVVLWDGTVIPCCVDYNATLPLGNAWKDKVLDLWHSKAIEDLRRKHLAREFPPVCADCNECDTSKTQKRFFYASEVAS